jgi:A/G-specific adenine glycosylase
MDLGATVCVRARPVCAACPVNDTCIARRQRTIDRLPTPRPVKQRPVRSAVVLVLRTEDGALLFEQRPPAGIWGGLLSLPEFDAAAADAAIVDEVAARYGMRIEITEALGQIKHEFTHYTLMMQPRVAHVSGGTAMRSTTLHAVNESELQAVPLPAPIRRLLLQLCLQFV